MNIWNSLTTRFAPRGDKLNFATDATPSADEWLVSFTESFMGHPDAAHATNTLMSSLRYFTAEFVAGVASLPSPEARRPPIAGRIPRAVYTATATIIQDVYHKLISQNAERGQIQAAFAQAVPVLVSEYNHRVL